jgi:EAL domain-containing protein (putative c-di-GMP-specific phosphodiesterase class I)
MYQAKRLGKNRCQMFTSELREQAVRKHLIEMEFRRALCESQISVAYQPLVSLETGRLRGFEALVRWIHPTLGTISPDEFIPIAEETGHIMQMGRNVIEETCKQMKRWERAIPSSRNLTMSVNESPSQLIAPPNALRLKECMHENGIEPRRIVVEITESALMIDPLRAARNIDLLHVLGVKVHMDDFGTGYSSLANLHKFSFDALKIDRSFVSGEGDGLANPEIVETIIALAGQLNLSVTAEGIETATQERSLRSLGCDTGQGYLFSRPLSESEALAFIAADAEMGLQFHAATA